MENVIVPVQFTSLKMKIKIELEIRLIAIKEKAIAYLYRILHHRVFQNVKIYVEE